MENAADALKMAAAVLVFVLALSISMNAFSEVRATATTLLEYNDREYDYSYVEEITEIKNGKEVLVTERVVGAESIIPTIYKAYTENYKIVFTNMGTEPLYEKNGQPVYKIDLEKEKLADDEDKFRFLKALLNGPSGDDVNYFSKNKGITFQTPLYERKRRNQS